MRTTTIGATFALVFLASFLCVAEVANANPYHHEAYFTEVPPPIGAHAPVILIHSPLNGSSYPKNVTLVFDVTILETNGEKSISAVSKLYYRASWEQNEIVISEYGFSDNASFSIDLSGVRGGNLTIAIFAVGYGSYVTKEEFDSKTYTMIAYYDTFEMTGYATVSFTKDLVPPRITVQSPQNKTYSSSNVELDFTVSEDTSLIQYCLDGKGNQTITGSTTLTAMTEGAHNVTLYASDLAGNPAAPKTLYFNVNLPDTLPAAPITAAVIPVAILASIAAGLLFYRRRRTQ